MDRPLEGIRVLDFSRLIPGPWCSMLLADLGADVIKVETPLAGDYARMAPPELGFGGIFEALNRGKRSLAVNWRLARGREVVLRLAREADVLLESSMPGQLARRGLGPDDVVAVNPRLVYCSLSGYGQTGPYRDRPGHDLDYLAIGGLLALLGPAGKRPVPPGLQLADLTGGTLAALQIVAALAGRERTGRGAVLDVAVLDAVAAWLGTLGTGRATASAAPGPLAGAYPCYQVYPTADGRHLAVGALEPNFWVAFCAAIDREDLVPRQYDPPAIAEVAAVLASRTREAWLAHFGPDTCVVAVNSPAEAELDPQLRARGLVTGEGDEVRVRSPLRALTPPESDGRSPGLGADTYAVLAEAGLAPDEVAELEAAGIVAGPATPEATAKAARLGTALARLASRSKARAEGAGPAAHGGEPATGAERVPGSEG